MTTKVDKLLIKNNMPMAYFGRLPNGVEHVDYHSKAVSNSGAFSHAYERDKATPYRTVKWLSSRMYDVTFALDEMASYHDRAPFISIFLIFMKDISIQANLRYMALNKKPSHRNWREWYAITDYLEDNIKLLSKEINHLHYMKLWLFCFGVAAGLIISYLISL